MAKKLTVIEQDRLPRPVPNENFNMEFTTVAGTPGAPKIATGIPGNKITITREIFDHIETNVHKLHKKGGLLCISSFVLTSPRILIAAAAMDSIAVAQKASPREGTLRMLLRLKCKWRRNELPGKIFSHLVRRDQQDDFGIVEGFRWVGNHHQTSRWESNETRPYLHPKIIIGLVPNKKNKLKSAFSYTGSANISTNAEGSFEMMEYSEDEGYITQLFDVFAFYWALSEGLYNFSQGVQPTYTWLDSAQKFTPSPICPDCGATHLYPAWVEGGGVRPLPYRVLRCVKCKSTIPYLKEHQPVLL